MRSLLKAARWITASAVLLAALVSPSRAQHLGDVSLSTVSTTLATNLPCTGAAQNFITGTTANFSNVGQIRHFATVASIIGIQKMQVEIDGLDNQGNSYRISDVMEFAGILTTRQGTLTGTGSFPRIQVSVTCTPAVTGTFTMSYSGDFGSSGGISGTYLTTQLDHVNFFGAPANVNQSDNFQSPTGSSAGLLYFQYNTASVANGTLAVFCNTVGIAAATSPLLVVALANSTALQTFVVPAVPCPLVQVSYGSPGGGSGVTAEYVFTPPPGNLQITGADPCQSSALAKQSVAIAAAAAATTQLVPLGTVNTINVCGFVLTQAAAGTFQFISGSGALCATGTVNQSGVVTTLASTPVAYGGAGQTIFKGLLGQAICIVTTGAAATANGVLTFVQP